MLKHRVITALILIPITLLLIFYLPQVPFGIFTALIVVACAWEWTNLMGMRDVTARLFYVLLFSSMLPIILFVHVYILFFIAFLWWIFAAFLILIYPYCVDYWSKNLIWRGIMGVLVLIPTWAAINFIRGQVDGIYALLFLLVLVFGADTTAYFVGKQWGKTKLAPKISPGKTWQGFMGALVFALILSMVVLWLVKVPINMWPWAIGLSLLTVMFSVIGDLFESMLKRQVGIKDSGTILPGHGGLLDRLDSLTAAAPVYTFGALVLGMYLSP